MSQIPYRVLETSTTAVFAAALDMAYHIAARGGPDYRQALLTGAAAGAGEFLYDYVALGSTTPVSAPSNRYARTAAATVAPALVDAVANGGRAGLTQTGLAGAASGFGGHMLAQRISAGGWFF